MLRDIVIHALGMGNSPTADQTHTGKGGASGSGLAPHTKQRKYKTSPHMVAMEKTPNGMVAMEKTPNGMVATEKTLNGMVAMEKTPNGMVAMGKTPSPHSRQSSGFGSLQDEDGGLCESFSKELTKPLQTEVYYTMPLVPEDTHSRAKPATSREKPVVTAPPHQHHTPPHKHSGPSGVMSSGVMSSATKVESLNSQELQLSLYGHQPHSQSTSAFGSENQGMKEALVPRPTLFDLEAEGPQSFSKGKSRPGMKHQVSRKHQMFREHQELIGEVQILALKVEEEKLQ